ncbi:MAG TPA: MOSC domain-containing protein [Sulfurivirga caldicuralii]|nr:MOSC domain-containing protein [Sulfurivirga caldicuralii]
MTDVLISLNRGSRRTFHWRQREVASCIIKHPLYIAEMLTPTGLADDCQVDHKNHGGPDKALLVIPAANYARFGVHKHWGFLGENLTFPDRLDEKCVHLGDRFQLGDVLLEVTQPRSPCWKLDELAKTQAGKHHFLQTYAGSGHVGFYVRVLRTGLLCAGLSIEHQPAEQPAPSIHALFLAKHGGGKTAEQRSIIEQALAHPALSTAWREELGQLLKR